MRERPLHGGEDRSAAPVVLDFSVNTNPLGMPPAVRQLLREETSLAEQYPDRTAKALRESLAAKWKVPPEQILMGNGASEILMLAALALAPKEVLIPSPSFSGYARAFEAAGSAVRYLPLLPEEQFELTERFFAEISCGTGAAVLCNPNNPTGRAADPDLLTETAKRCEERGITLLLDECFLSFLPDGEARTFLTRTKEFPHLLIVRAATARSREMRPFLRGWRLSRASGASLPSRRRRDLPPLRIRTGTMRRGNWSGKSGFILQRGLPGKVFGYCPEKRIFFYFRLKRRKRHFMKRCSSAGSVSAAAAISAVLGIRTDEAGTGSR